jgi:hypothetical protein
MVQSSLKVKKGGSGYTTRVRAPQKPKAKTAIDRLATKARSRSIQIIEQSLAKTAKRHHGQKPLHVVSTGAPDAIDQAQAKRRVDGDKKPKAAPKVSKFTAPRN